jgi:hypothetical protein
MDTVNASAEVESLDGLVCQEVEDAGQHAYHWDPFA